MRSLSLHCSVNSPDEQRANYSEEEAFSRSDGRILARAGCLFAGDASRLHLGRRRNADCERAGESAQRTLWYLVQHGTGGLFSANFNFTVAGMAALGNARDWLSHHKRSFACGKLSFALARAAAFENPRRVAGGVALCGAPGERRIRRVDRGAQKYFIAVFLFALGPFLFAL